MDSVPPARAVIGTSNCEWLGVLLVPVRVAAGSSDLVCHAQQPPTSRLGPCVCMHSHTAASTPGLS